MFHKPGILFLPQIGNHLILNLTIISMYLKIYLREIRQKSKKLVNEPLDSNLDRNLYRGKPNIAESFLAKKIGDFGKFGDIGQFPQYGKFIGNRNYLAKNRDIG